MGEKSQQRRPRCVAAAQTKRLRGAVLARGLDHPWRLTRDGKIGVVSDYTPSEVAALLEQDGVQLIDVRTAAEHEAGHIAGDRWIELNDLPAQAETIDQDQSVIFYCRSGARSGMATEALQRAGYDAHNMAGGLLEWYASELPLKPADGHVAEH